MSAIAAAKKRKAEGRATYMDGMLLSAVESQERENFLVICALLHSYATPLSIMKSLVELNNLKGLHFKKCTGPLNTCCTICCGSKDYIEAKTSERDYRVCVECQVSFRWLNVVWPSARIILSRWIPHPGILQMIKLQCFVK